MTQRIGENRVKNLAITSDKIANNSISIEKLSNLANPNLVFDFANTAYDTAVSAFSAANSAFEAANNVSSNAIVNGSSNVTISVADSTVDVSVNGFINVVSFTSNVTVCNSHVNPISTNTWDLGSSALRWRNIYTNDLNLNNGIGDWTIVEGEDDLFLYNNKNNKVYKFALVEVDASEATPKIDGLK